MAYWLGALPANAADAGPAAASAPWPGYEIKFFRFDEDYSRLRTSEAPLGFPLRLKYLPLTDDGGTFLSLGGEYRLRLDSYDHPDFGMRNAPAFLSVEQRMLLHADLHMGDAFRAFFQLGNDLEHGRKPFARPSDRSWPDIAQAFVDFNVGPADARWRLRIGRQEVGIGRYIAVRDGTNIRRTFDGARLDGEVAGFVVIALAARATRNQQGAFDDFPDSRDEVALVAVEHALPLAGYKLGLTAVERDNEAAMYAAGNGVEHRRMVSARIYGSDGGWDADGQISYQFGTFAPIGKERLTIAARGAAFEGGRSFVDLPWSPRLAIRIDGAEGDDNPKDRHLGTFDLPYPNFSYLTEAAIFAPRNVHDVQPFLTVNPTKTFSLTVGAEMLWRNTSQDAVYSPADTEIRAPGGHGLYIATQPYLRASWRPMPLIEWQAAYVHAIPGEALKTANGRRSLDFAFASVAVHF
jgi:hypothetical protein